MGSFSESGFSLVAEPAVFLKCLEWDGLSEGNLNVFLVRVVVVAGVARSCWCRWTRSFGEAVLINGVVETVILPDVWWTTWRRSVGCVVRVVGVVGL